MLTLYYMHLKLGMEGLTEYTHLSQSMLSICTKTIPSVDGQTKTWCHSALLKGGYEAPSHTALLIQNSWQAVSVLVSLCHFICVHV